MIAEVMKDGFLDRHVPTIRALYKSQRDAMLAALQREMRGLDVTWNTPAGGMFLWARLPQGHGRHRTAAQGGGPRAWPSCPARLSTPAQPDHAHAAPVVRDRQRRSRSTPASPRSQATIREQLRPGRLKAMLKIWGRISSINVRKVVLAAQWLELAVRAHRRRAAVRHREDAGVPGQESERPGAAASRTAASRSGSPT